MPALKTVLHPELHACHSSAHIRPSFLKFNFLRGRKFRWGVFKGARGGGLGVGCFKRGADLEHNPYHPIMALGLSAIFTFQMDNTKR